MYVWTVPANFQVHSLLIQDPVKLSSDIIDDDGGGRYQTKFFYPSYKIFQSPHT